MVALAAGVIALVPFPFSDLSRSKLRPTYVLAHAGRDEWILCQVTSQRFGDDRSVRVLRDDLESGRLLLDSFVRPGKLFTAAAGLVSGVVGRVTPDRRAEIVDAVVRIVRGER